MYPPPSYPQPLFRNRARGTRRGEWVRMFGTATGNAGLTFELALKQEVI